MTVTSGLHRQKDKERQRKTEEKGHRRPVVAPRYGVRWRGSSTCAPGSGPRIALAKNLRGQGSRLSTGQARETSTDDDDVYYYIRWRLELEGETENTGVCTKERKGVTAAVLMATPCTNSLGGESVTVSRAGERGPPPIP